MYQEKQAQWKAEVSGLQLQLQQLQEQQLEADPKAKVNYLETKIEESRAQIWRQEEEVMVIKDELEKQASENRYKQKPYHYIHNLQLQLLSEL